MLQSAKITSDYLPSLLPAELSVDSSQGSFFPVLPAPAGAPFAGTEVLSLLDASNDGFSPVRCAGAKTNRIVGDRAEDSGAKDL